MHDTLLSLIKEEPGALDLALHEPPPFIRHFPSEYILFCQTCLCQFVQWKVYSPPPGAAIFIHKDKTIRLQAYKQTKAKYSEQ